MKSLSGAKVQKKHETNEHFVRKSKSNGYNGFHRKPSCETASNKSTSRVQFKTS